MDASRIRSGELRAGTYVLNSVRGHRERIGRVLEMHANQAVARDVLRAGEIGAIVGLDHTLTGDTLFDGDYHDVDSNERAFHICASMGFKEAFRKAGPALLEPVMQVNVVTPSEHLGAVNGDLAARRGRIDRMEARAATHEIQAFVPLAEMFGYATQLRTLSRGTATFTMSFDHYEPVPLSIAEEIVEKRRAAQTTKSRP